MKLHQSHTSAGTDEACRCSLSRDHFEDDRGEVTVEELRDHRNTTERAYLDAMAATEEARRLERVAEQAHRRAERELREVLFASHREGQRLLSASSNA